MKKCMIKYCLQWTIILLFSQISFSQEVDPYQLLKSGKKNIIFSDPIYYFKPFYSIGYERLLSPKFSFSVGVIFLDDNSKYKIPFTQVEFGEYATFTKKNRCLNLFFCGTYDYDTRRNFFRNSISLGFQIINFNEVRMNDFFVRKSLLSLTIFKSYYMSLNIQAGLRYIKVIKNIADNNYNSDEKNPVTIQFHVPLIMGYRF